MPVLAAIPAGYIAAAGAAATVVGAGVSYMASQNAAAAASNQANYNAEIAANNQKTADQEAQATLQQATVQQQQKANQEEQQIGSQKAAFAANGVDVNSGSATSVLSDTAAAGTLDQLTIQNNAAQTAVGYKNQGINFGNQATLDNQASEQDLAAGNLAADRSVITGAGQVASQWYNFTSGTKQSGQGSTQ